MKEVLIALTLTLSSLIAVAAPAHAGGSATLLQPISCGPSQLAVGWTGADPTSVTLSYGSPDDGMAIRPNLGTWALTRSQKSYNAVALPLSDQQRQAIKTIQASSSHPTWFWSAATKSGAITSETFTCQYFKPPIVVTFR